MESINKFNFTFIACLMAKKMRGKVCIYHHVTAEGNKIIQDGKIVFYKLPQN